MSNRYLNVLNGRSGDELWWSASYNGKPVRCYWRKNPSASSTHFPITFAMFREENTKDPVTGYNKPELHCITVYTLQASIS